MVMVTSKKFHTYLILLMISGILSTLGSFSFVTQINKVPHQFEWLEFLSFLSSVLTLIVVSKLRKVNGSFLKAFICNIYVIILIVIEAILIFFSFNLVVESVCEGIDFTISLIGFVLDLYTINGIRDCYSQEDEKNRKVFKIYIWIILAFFLTSVVMETIAGMDFFVKNYFVSTIAKLTSVLFEVALPIVLTICYSRAAKMSSIALKAKKEEEGEIQNEQK